MLVFGFVAALLAAPRLTINIAIVALGLVFVGLIGLRFLAAALKLGAGKSAAKPAPMRHDLPVITLLIPLHKEAAVLDDDSVKLEFDLRNGGQTPPQIINSAPSAAAII